MKRWMLGMVCTFATGAAMAAPIVGQVNDFEDGTTQGWGVGGPSPNPPSNTPDGGPGGAGDAFLRFASAGGSGAGSRLSIQNTTQWAGDYLAAGVNGISFDIANLGTTPLQIALRIEGAGGAFSSLTPLAIPADGQWRSVSLGIDDASLTSTGPTDLDATLGDVFRLRIEDGRGALVATAGIDNIRALPEPGSLALLSLAALVLRRR